MADWYVQSGAGGTGSGADWANAKTTLAAACTAAAAGDRIFVSDTHSENQATAMTLTMPGTNAAPNQILCVNHLGSVPPVSADLMATAVVGVSGNVALTVNGSGYISGIILNGGTTTGTSANIALAQAAGNYQYYKNCAVALRNASVTAIVIGKASTATKVIFDNSTFIFGTNAGQAVSLQGGYFIWKNTATSAITWGTMPTRFLVIAVVGPDVFLEGINLSNYSGAIFETVSLNGRFVAKDCVTHASATLYTVPTISPAPIADFIRSDSGNTNYKVSRIAYEGTLTTETSIIRTGGATDRTTPLSWKAITSANSSLTNPFEFPRIAIWNDVSDGSTVTATIYGVWGGGAVPNNSDIYFELEYLSSATVPLGSTVTSGLADVLASATAWDADSDSTWGGSTTKFKKGLQFVPLKKGYIYITVKAITAATTFYIDPKPVLS